MAGDAAAARMGDPLTVAKQHIRPHRQRLDGGDRRRRFAEGEQSGHIRIPGSRGGPGDHLPRDSRLGNR